MDLADEVGVDRLTHRLAAHSEPWTDTLATKFRSLSILLACWRNESPDAPLELCRVGRSRRAKPSPAHPCRAR